jgi:glycerol-3-phosphate dehydrogenase (NAD(P)+)
MGKTLAVIGAGSWGTALSVLLARSGHRVQLHCYPAEIAAGIAKHRRNPLYFPDCELPEAITPRTDIAAALDGCATAFLVVPTRYLRGFMQDGLAAWQGWAEAGGRVLCNCTKGLLLEPTQRTDEWLGQLLPDAALAHLAGPNFARELMGGLPAAAVAAGPPEAAARVQGLLNSAVYRIYTGDDLVGVEVAGFYKNIIAVAAGAAHELGLGNNARASLVTRALAEMGRLVGFFDGQQATLLGLAGVGDLTLTCSSELSRNFQAGVRLARGQGLEGILAEMTQVAEGIQAARAVHLWPQEHGLDGWPELPIAAQVYAMLYDGTAPAESLKSLMQRPPKAE